MDEFDEDVFNVLLANEVDPATAYAASVPDDRRPEARRYSTLGIVAGIAAAVAVWWLLR